MYSSRLSTLQFLSPVSMTDEICKKQKVVPCNNNCYIINLNKASYAFTDHEHKILRDLCQNYKVTPCFASSIFYYLNIKIDCYMIYNKFRTDINHFYNIKPKIPEKMYLPSKITKENGKKMFTPCNHQCSCFKNKKCTCYKNNISCEMSCLCTHCDLTLKCDCKICDHNCICYKNNRNCSCHEECTNKPNKTKKVMICDTNIAGLGLFANEDIKKNEFVIEYIGEVIGHSEAERRGFFYDHKKLSYLFDFNCDDADYQTIDATRIGNEARFINHSGKPNLVARQIKVDGVFKMGFYAIENIKKGEEMYFDYKYNDEFKKKYNIHD